MFDCDEVLVLSHGVNAVRDSVIALRRVLLGSLIGVNLTGMGVQLAPRPQVFLNPPDELDHFGYQVSDR
jgi:hypothetical protein